MLFSRGTLESVTLDSQFTSAKVDWKDFTMEDCNAGVIGSTFCPIIRNVTLMKGASVPRGHSPGLMIEFASMIDEPKLKPSSGLAAGPGLAAGSSPPCPYIGASAGGLGAEPSGVPGACCRERRWRQLLHCNFCALAFATTSSDCAEWPSVQLRLSRGKSISSPL